MNETDANIMQMRMQQEKDRQDRAKARREAVRSGKERDAILLEIAPLLLAMEEPPVAAKSPDDLLLQIRRRMGMEIRWNDPMDGAYFMPKQADINFRAGVAELTRIIEDWIQAMGDVCIEIAAEAGVEVIADAIRARGKE